LPQRRAAHDKRSRARQEGGVHIRSSPEPLHHSGPIAAARVTLPAVTESVPAARRFVRKALTEIDAAGACDDAVALVSELATNAVIHARSSFTIVVSREGDSVRVSVHDGSSVIPRRRAYGVNATTGRGLRLVASVSSDWGIAAETGGKVVWFEVPCEGTLDVAGWYADVDVDELLKALDDGDRSESSPVAGGATE
jgi:anti-sigma regulatory factor (Ser/Thr protein kinase)